VPGHVDGVELAARAVIGQQVTVVAARTLATRLVADLGTPLDLAGDHHVTHLFPSAEALAGIDADDLAMPRARGRALAAVATALAEGSVVLDRSADRGEVRAHLLALPGIGPWTADYIAFRVLGDPDVFLPTDVGVRHAAARLGIDDVAGHSEHWRTWRSYALIHLWSSLGDPETHTDTEAPKQKES
jgi:AraC family transcriptional regulator of adaptative response / DNA-3-methyladenine glycosylase II